MMNGVIIDGDKKLRYDTPTRRIQEETQIKADSQSISATREQCNPDSIEVRLNKVKGVVGGCSRDR